MDSIKHAEGKAHLVPPPWLGEWLGIELPAEGGTVELGGEPYRLKGGVLRAGRTGTGSQAQTARAFGFKWGRRTTFESETSLSRVREWLVERYGNVTEASWWEDHGENPLVLDAGCGAAMSALELFQPLLPSLRFVGVEISDAIDVAASRFTEQGLEAAFIQADVTRLPVAEESVDLIFSEGVLHHTDSTREALLDLSRLLRPGGRFLFYVYRRKGPIREFTDDYIRDRLQGLSPDEAWDALVPLSRLGQALGELDVEVEVPEDIGLLDIPAGRYPLQRLVYWHVLKAFHRPGMSFEEMHHVNFDWFAPANAHRQTPEEVRDWCAEAGLEIQRENLQPAGITIVARKRS